MTNREQLLQYIQRHGVTAVAAALHLSEIAVRAKMRVETSKAARPVSDRDIDFLRLKLGAL